MVLGAVGFVRGAPLSIPYLVLVLVAGAVVVRSEVGVRYSTLALTGLAVWALTHLAGGLIQLDDGRIFYNVVFFRWIHFDNVVHLIGFGSAGLACWEALTSSGLRFSPRQSFFIACLSGMGLGAANEVFEFASTHVLATTGVGGFQNTGRDLVANLLGGLVAGSVAARRTGSERPAAPPGG